MNNLELVKKVGFDFSWDEKKVWQLSEPVTMMPVSELEWHFDVPFWNENEGIYNLSAREVIEVPERHTQEFERVRKADVSHPLDIMKNKGRWLLLDGLHRLVKLYSEGEKEVAVRIIPRTRIPEIYNYDETVEECRRTLQEEGFLHVYEWTDNPGALYEEHTHKGRVSLFIVRGGVHFTIDGNKKDLITGDRLDIPVGAPHSAIVGQSGCTYVVGEEIKGDS